MGVVSLSIITTSLIDEILFRFWGPLQVMPLLEGFHWFLHGSNHSFSHCFIFLSSSGTVSELVWQLTGNHPQIHPSPLHWSEPQTLNIFPSTHAHWPLVRLCQQEASMEVWKIEEQNPGNFSSLHLKKGHHWQELCLSGLSIHQAAPAPELYSLCLHPLPHQPGGGGGFSCQPPVNPLADPPSRFQFFQPCHKLFFHSKVPQVNSLVWVLFPPITQMAIFILPYPLSQDWEALQSRDWVKVLWSAKPEMTIPVGNNQMYDSLKQRISQLTSVASPSHSLVLFRRIQESFAILYRISLYQLS